MNFTLHRSFPSDIENEWNALLEKSPSNTPFLRYDYLVSWWKTHGGGEWKDADLMLVTARQDGQLIGIAPLFFVPDRRGKPALLLLGSIEISDYLDLIAESNNLEVFITELLPFLNQPEFSSWEFLDWCNIPENSPTLPLLEKAAGQLGWIYQAERLQPCPIISLNGNWENYLAGIDKKQRHEIRRKMRRLEESDLQSRWYIVDDAARVDSEMDDFLGLMERDAEKKNFLSEAMREHMHLTARNAFANGTLLLAFLEIEGKKAAGKFCFDYSGKILGYNSGVSGEFMHLSPGWVLTGSLIRWACEHQRTEFDFMRGNEEYKYRLGGIDRYVMEIVIRK
jgi:CelD/BcsL family acetyltransferase involved in cellulose biosynthesis